MRTIPDKRITTNFSLYEFIEARLPREAVALNWQHIREFREHEFIRLANFLQELRGFVNQRFKAENGGREIGLNITSGFRCLVWEKIRKRSGLSKHCTLAAADVQPANCSPELAIKIMAFFYERHSPSIGGHQGGFAIKRPTYKNGGIELIGFLHYDLDSQVRRWEYA